ncbi:dUTP diphosphatase [Clostridium perfringens]|uniref:dUTP diphosphatase n=2 Tax=Clostridium perfringens TaxID=1502 RepID=A0A2X2YDR9_CLOPF|nr:aminotransferase [Clostridium perfringens]AXH51730.1 aminotransferase [Clostridium perfringens]EDS79449.1 deoxyuridine 5-triphosphate nucleotidohydrolase [Clostridium perfringens C str. JGS1495]EDT16479.1 deoxyuridine 5-triphosphate nucleotidohydrolase [Clostridium perfringens E str. JGS1987]EHK2387846.1 aminotransferase [Clostridium perfringens]EHK2403996.1 aminotransferase [Clostridium perfringens]
MAGEQRVRDVYIQYDKNGETPKYETPLAAGADLFAAEDMVIRPFEKVAIPLGLKFAIPDNMELQIRARSGLSLRTNLKISNSIGTIDADSVSDISVILENNYNIANLPYEIANDISILDDLKNNYTEVRLSDYLESKGHDISSYEDEGKKAYIKLLKTYIYLDKNGNPYGTIYIKKGNRIAQMVLAKYYKANFIKTDDVSKLKSVNRGGGFGHTGF